MNSAALAHIESHLDDDDRTSESGEATLRILLAEHDHNLRRLIALVLRRDGHLVAEAGDGAELLDAVATLIVDSSRPYDLIISEQRLPGIQGLSVLSALRLAADATPFVLMTGDREVQAQAGRLGAVILDHPLNVKTIRSAVRCAPWPKKALK